MKKNNYFTRLIFFLRSYISQMTLRHCFVAVFIFLIALHFNSLDNPAYWDTVLGSLHQAVWLKKNFFNYKELLSMPSYGQGGPLVYVYSAYPLIQALWMEASPTIPIFFMINHLIQLLIAAVSAIILFKLCVRISTTKTAILISVLWLSMPIFNSLASSINMDFPVAVFSLLSFFFFSEKKYKPCFITLIVALLIKQTAAITLIGLTAMLCMTRLKKKSDIKWLISFIFIALIFVIGPRLVALSRGFIRPLEVPVSLSDWLKHPLNILNKMQGLYQFVPDHTIFMIVSFISSIAIILGILTFSTKVIAKHKSNSAPIILSTILKNEVIIYSGLIVIGFMILLLALEMPLPRYLIWIIPYQLLLLGAFLHKKFTQKYQSIILLTAIALNILNYSGALYKLVNKTPFDGFGAVLERSMEYQDDLRCNQKLAHVAESQLKNFTLITCWPLTHILSTPEFGYVTEPLSVISVNGPGLPALDVPHISDQGAIDPTRPIIIITTKSNYFGLIQFNPEHHTLVGIISHKARQIILFVPKKQ